MKNSIFVNIVFLLIAAMFIGGAACMLPGMYQQRLDTGMDRLDTFRGEEVSSDLKLPTSALFVFRSLAIDYLWIRADNLKNDGQFFDALYLSRAICALQPNLASIWDFQGWNMAYNISVELPTGAERWEWVRAGFELLRDQGLKYNPDSLRIHWSLAWIFQHKMGGITDDYHRYYKMMLAYELAPLLTPIYGDVTARPVLEDIKAMADLPEDFAELIKDQAVADLMDLLIASDDKFQTPEDVFKALVKLRVSPKGTYNDEVLWKLIYDNAENPALWVIDRYSRRMGLRDSWKLEPSLMHELDLKYGPIDYTNEDKRMALDWRMPWPYAIYWAEHGLRKYKDRDQTQFDINRLERVVYQGLQDMYHYGNLKIYQFRPPKVFKEGSEGREVFEQQQLSLQVYNNQDLKMFPVAYQATLDLMNTYKDDPDEMPGGVDVASENLAINAIQSLYLTGYRQVAAGYYKRLQQDFPGKPEYTVPLETFVASCMKQQLEDITPKYASNYVMNLLRDSYQQLGLGEDENAQVRLLWAEQIYKLYYKDFQNDPDPTARTELPSFDEMKYYALLQVIFDDYVDRNVVAMLMKRIEIEQPSLYDKVVKEIEKQRAEYEKAKQGSDDVEIGPQQEQSSN